MLSANFSISPTELWNLLGTAHAPQVIDTRRRAVHDAASGLLPTATWRDIGDIEQWKPELDRERMVVFACRYGHQMSQIPTAHLRGDGFDARVLAGGHEAWTTAKLPLISKAALDRLAPTHPSLWVTRRRPKIDRIACPWLIRRFIDAQARILYVDADQVAEVAKESGAVPFDIPGVEIGHQGDRCSFDALMRTFELEGEPALDRLALIVRAADTGRPDLAPEAPGLLAISHGLSALAGDDDHGMLSQGMVVYDALFANQRGRA